MDLSKLLDATPEPSVKIQEAWLGSLSATNYNNSNEDYCLPTPMADFQKELTDDIVSLHYSDLLKYFETNNKDDFLLIDSLQKLFLNIQLISSHPYLLIDHFMPKSLVAKDIPTKLIQTSGKFKVLKNILDILSGVHEFRKLLKSELHSQLKHEFNDATQDGQSNKKVNQAIISSVKKRLIAKADAPGHKNVLIIAREGKTLDLIESLLLGLKVKYVKHSGAYLRNNNNKEQNMNDVSFQKKVSTYSVNLSSNLKNYLNNSNFNLSPLYALTVHLISSKDLIDNSANATKLTKSLQSSKLDLVIPFDLSAGTKIGVLDTLRRKNYKTRKAPILRLVPIYTVEHIALNFDYNNGDPINENFRNTISAVVVERGKVGLIDANLKTIYNNNLDYLQDWLLHTSNGRKWPLPPITAIPIYSPQDVEKSLLTEVKYAPEDDYSEFDDESELKKKTELNDKLEFDNFEKFKELYLKTPNDYFYDTKRLRSRYLFNPLQLKNRSSIIGIEAESINFVNNEKAAEDVASTETYVNADSTIDHDRNADNYYNYLTKELILTHFEIYGINLRYLKYNKVGVDVENSKYLNKIHREDFKYNLTEFEKFLQQNQNLIDKHQALLEKKHLLQKYLAQDKVSKLTQYFENRLVTSQKNDDDGILEKIKMISSDKLETYKQWEKKQLRILELLSQKEAAKKSLGLKQNELNYLTIELDKLTKLNEENVNQIKNKTQLLEVTLSNELNEFIDKYNSIGTEPNDERKSAKRRKLNELISEVDGLMLNIKQEISVNEDIGYNKNRNRYRRK